MKHNRRGLSVIVSSLLMIFVAVACSALTYFWVTSLIESQSALSQTEIRVEQVTWIDAKNLKVAVRNLGSTSATIESVSVKKRGSDSSPESIQVNTSISPGALTEMHVTLSTTTLEDNTPYVVKATTTTGFYYEFNSFTGVIH